MTYRDDGVVICEVPGSDDTCFGDSRREGTNALFQIWDLTSCNTPVCEPVVCGCSPGFTTVETTDDDGCVTSCDCVTEAPVCEPVVCGCSPGFTTVETTDDSGCVTSCDCVTEAPVCEPVVCGCSPEQTTVETTDDSGCVTSCECVDPPVETTAPETTTTTTSAATTATVDITSLGVYSTWTGTEMGGSANLRFYGTSVEITWDLTDVDLGCDSGPVEGVGNSCGVHIHSGTSCIAHALAGGHYYDSESLSADPWATVGYTASGTESSGSVMVDYGYDYSETEGKAFVIHDSTGARVTCALIGKTETVMTLTPIGSYPESDATAPTGTVTLGFVDTMVSIAYDLSGVDSTCTAPAEGVANSCGIHIHSGTSCAAAADVGGHFYSSSLEADPWSDAVFVVTDESAGTAVGTLQVEYGENYDNTVGRTFVIHESGGGRVSCNRMGVCGDSVCDENETSSTCEVDCPTTTTTTIATTTTTTTEAPQTYEDSCSVYQTRTLTRDDCSTNWLSDSVKDRLASKPTNSDWDLCIIDNGDGTSEWGVIDDDDTVYRTCVQASTSTDTACDGNLVCGTAVVGNSNAQSWTLSYVTRSNYMHQDCPSIQSECAVQSNWWYGKLEEAAPTKDSAWIRGNVCVGEDSMVRVVTKEALVDTCVGYQYESGEVNNLVCPADRDYICGTLVSNGRPVFGWPTAMLSMVSAALDTESYVHPDCGPFLQCC